MKAIWKDQVIAQSDNTIVIEGNHYFPKSNVDQKFLTNSDTHTTCHWKGEASYYNVKVDNDVNEDAAWYYPEPTPNSIQIVGQDFSDYIAFWKGVSVVE